jgi:hypothetical protein
MFFISRAALDTMPFIALAGSGCPGNRVNLRVVLIFGGAGTGGRQTDILPAKTALGMN